MLVLCGKVKIPDAYKKDKEVVTKFGDGVQLPEAHRAYLDEFKKMRGEISNVDLPDAAERLGGTSANGKLTVKFMGKDVSVDANGKFYTDIHVNGWVERPVLTAIAWLCRYRFDKDELADFEVALSKVDKSKNIWLD